ncbi:MAG TPA: hypothetical protein VME66_06115 [Candidatus Acidoferrales bacterium]|nr:hypothetical protein [Candidatus Acidoferrales bacterium]
MVDDRGRGVYDNDLSIAKVSARSLTQIADPYAAHSLTPEIVEGGDGNVWVPYYDYIDGDGLDRVTPSGTLTSFPLGASLNGQVLGAAAAPDGSIWTVVSVFSSSSDTTVYDVERTTSTGTTTQIGTLANSPSNLLFGPDKNLWFAVQGGVGNITPSGTVSTYTLPLSTPVYGGSNVAFVVGSDGNFWAPYPLGALTLLKFSTSGTVVSNAPLAYAPPGTTYSSGPASARSRSTPTAICTLPIPTSKASFGLRQAVPWLSIRRTPRSDIRISRRSRSRSIRQTSSMSPMRRGKRPART